MKISIYIVVLFVLLQSCGLSGTPGKKDIIKGRQVIFNGKDTRGWKHVGNFDVEIENDALFLTATDSEEGFLTSEKSYGDFILEAEFLAPFIRSGIAFRYDDSQEGVLAENSYLVNIDWDKNQQNPMGSIIQTARANLMDSVEAGQWHSLKIEAIGNHLKVYIDEVLLCETHDAKRTSGKLILQAPAEVGQTVGFRELILEEFPIQTNPSPILEQEYRRNTTQKLEPLFPADNFEGWNIIGDGSWRINQGVVHGYSGIGGGYLVSEKTYKNFYLKFSFKIKKEENSGIFIRKSPQKYEVSLDDALECNIYDHNGFTHPYSTGSIVNHARAWHGMIAYGNWNEMEIFAKEDHVVMYVNGEKSSDTHVSSTYNKAGNICLQAGIKIFDPGKGPSDIYFKDMLIRNMDNP